MTVPAARRAAAPPRAGAPPRLGAAASAPPAPARDRGLVSIADVTFDAMGSEMRVIVRAARRTPSARPPTRAPGFDDVRRRAVALPPRQRALRAQRRPARRRAGLARCCATAVAAGLWAAERTGGLVDPTLVGEIEAAGYARLARAASRRRRSLRRSRGAPRAGPRGPSPARRWRAIDGRRGGRHDPPPAGRRASTAAAPARASPPTWSPSGSRGYPRFVVDCGGDIRVGGAEAARRPFEVHVEHPLTGERAHVLRVGGGGVATSGLDVRDLAARRTAAIAHHLLDPATGEPAWTGLVGATALGADRARGGDARQGGAALRPGRRAARARASAAA